MISHHKVLRLQGSLGNLFTKCQGLSFWGKPKQVSRQIHVQQRRLLTSSGVIGARGFNMSELPVYEYDAQLQQKVQHVRGLFQDVANIPELQIIASPRKQHFRDRANVVLWSDMAPGGEVLDTYYNMFEDDDSALGRRKKRRVRIDSLPMASKCINATMGPLLEAVKKSKVLRWKLFEVRFLANLKGDDMVVTMLYHKPLDEEWVEVARALEKELGGMVHVVGRSKNQIVVVSQDYIMETFTVGSVVYNYKQCEGTFTQPNASMCQHMLEWAAGCAQYISEQGGQRRDCLELYCGNGNFTLPLAAHFRKVFATEMVKQAVDAARWNIEHNSITNITVARLSSEDFSQAYTGVRDFFRLSSQGIRLSEYDFGTIFVDPPRAGIDPLTLALMSKFDHIMYVSCNPETLRANLNALLPTHSIARFALFDQFPFSAHIEAGVLLVRR